MAVNQHIWPWDSQPQEAVELDLAVTTLLTPVGAGAGKFREIGPAWTYSGTLTNAPAPFGLARNTTSAYLSRANPYQSGGFTIGIVYTPSSVSGDEGIWSIANSYTSSGPHFILQRNGVNLRVYSGGAYAITLSGVFAVGQQANIALSFSDITESASVNTTINVAINGRTATNTSFQDAAVITNEYFMSGYNGQADGAYGLFWGIPEAMDIAQVRDLSLQPWSIYAPRTIPVPVSAGGGGGSSVELSPSKGVLSLTGKAPSLVQSANLSLAPGKASLALAGKVASVSQSDHRTVVPASGHLAHTGYTASVVQSVHRSIEPTVRNLVLTGNTPEVAQTTGLGDPYVEEDYWENGYSDTGPIILAPAKAALILTGKTPTVVCSANVVLAPPKAAVVLSGKVPTVARTANVLIAPVKGSLALVGNTPTAVSSNNKIVEPIKGVLAFTGKTPTFVQTSSSVLAPSKRALSLTGKTPVVTQSASGTQQPLKGSLTLTGKVPLVVQSVHRVLEPVKGTLAFAGKTPVFAQSKHVALAPSAAALRLTCHVPGVLRSSVDNHVVEPGKADLRFTCRAPTVVRTTGTALTPSKAGLRYSGNTPALLRTAHVVLVPGKGSIRFTGKVPRIFAYGVYTASGDIVEAPLLMHMVDAPLLENSVEVPLVDINAESFA